MRNLASQRNVTHAIKQAAVVAVGAPRQQARREIAGCIIGCIELKQFLKHSMRWIFLGSEVSEGEIAHFSPGIGLLQETQRFFFADFTQSRGCLIRMTSLMITKI